MHVNSRSCDLCKCCAMKDFARSRMRFDGSMNDRENMHQKDAFDWTMSLHERQTRKMLCGAELFIKSKANMSFVGVGGDIMSDVERRRVLEKIRWRISVGSLWIGVISEFDDKNPSIPSSKMKYPEFSGEMHMNSVWVTIRTANSPNRTPLAQLSSPDHGGRCNFETADHQLVARDFLRGSLQRLQWQGSISARRYKLPS